MERAWTLGRHGQVGSESATSLEEMGMRLEGSTSCDTLGKQLSVSASHFLICEVGGNPPPNTPPGGRTGNGGGKRRPEEPGSTAIQAQIQDLLQPSWGHCH